MSFIVSGQTPVTTKGLGALLAFVRLFASMQSIVDNQTALPRKRFWTLLAFVTIFMLLCSNVIDQIFVASKLFQAQPAPVRLFTRVRSVVDSQIIEVSKGSGTQLALIRFVVQGSLNHAIHTAALLTSLGTLLFGTMGNQVADDLSMICGDMGAGAASELDVFGWFQWAAGLPQQSISITKLYELRQTHTNRRLIARRPGTT